ncbi:ABC transporter substrate-binding protein [Saccharothrix coeruleofusca]|uniref:Branched-chain amino acid ABC transporter substrate-binding protein n=1 Tax=Saccharothrix coeruleofusca TaxID=33919 RepID=A0A918EGA1_9PSEU|nr:ABC transporter substrate-binding protein [Saccharothrix coeruleofusca]MBP2335228.1 ABC-type branched-subunit amino acid transport system substrate-binding protein [Saccharothrix coeruleofusca]GGP71683.1 branched-chain amino acid ABC transporter substrate-binding protein [Saccharothrix coeruleofusca]
MRAFALVLTAAAVLASGCSSPAGDDARVEAGPGVGQDSIALGVLTDMTGPFSTSAKLRITAYELFLEQLNARGGVCGREVELRTADHGYDVNRALEGFFRLEPEVLGFIDITGAPMTEALEPEILQTRVLAAPASWSASLLGNPHMMVVGTTYDLDVINGMDHLRANGVIRDGDTIGHIHVDSDYGDNGLEGSQFAAQQWGMRLVTKSVAETDTDLAEEVAQLRAAGAKAVLLSTAPTQTAVAVGVAAQLGWQVPFMVNAVGYDPQMLDTPAAPAVLKQVLVVSPIAPFATDQPGPRAVAEAFGKAHPDLVPSAFVDHGYATATAFATVLEKACQAGDLTRDGVLRAFQDTASVDTGGLTGPLRFSLAGRPSSTQSYVARPSRDVPGGLEVVAELFESELVPLKGTRAR